MTRALIAIALLLPAATQFAPAPRQSLCVPTPPRTTPHRKLDRVDKWQHDERTLA
jgi:hypothetical protein